MAARCSAAMARCTWRSTHRWSQLAPGPCVRYSPITLVTPMNTPDSVPTIVRLTREDFEAVAHILSESGLQVDLEAELGREIALPWVLRSPGSGQPLAFSLAWSVADELHLLDMASHPEHRRQGHARALLSELLSYARRE